MKKEVKKNTIKNETVKSVKTKQKVQKVKELTLYTFDDVVSAFYQGLLRGSQCSMYLCDVDKKSFVPGAVNSTLNDFKESPELLKELSMMPLREYLLYIDGLTDTHK